MELEKMEMDDMKALYRVAAENGLSRDLVYGRINESSWDAERAVTEACNEKHRATGAWERWKDIAVVNYQLFRTRLSRGKTEEQAALEPAKKARGRAVAKEQIDLALLAAHESQQQHKELFM